MPQEAAGVPRNFIYKIVFNAKASIFISYNLITKADVSRPKFTSQNLCRNPLKTTAQLDCR